MKKKTKGLAKNMGIVAIMPILCLGIVILFTTAVTTYESAAKETEEGLRNLAHVFCDICENRGQGDYALEQGVLTKGGEPFDPDHSLVDRIHSTAGVDVTIFWNDIRAVTSIKDKDSPRAVGTKADPRVVQAVLKKGEEYFFHKIRVNGHLYFGYYVPLTNTDGSITGMIFVGKQRNQVLQDVYRTMGLLMIIIIAAVILVSIIILSHSRKIVRDLSRIEAFLKGVSRGEDKLQMDANVLKRPDEIGEIGRLSIKLQSAVAAMVGTDELTGLYNRRKGAQLLEEAISEYGVCKTPFSLAIGDIDNFKHVNDHYGHLAGDAVLQKFSKIFSSHMKQKGFACRWGGEEFVLVYRKMEAEHARICLEEILEEIRSTVIDYGGQQITATITFGLSGCREGIDGDGLIREADEKLYQGKQQGKNRIIS